MAEQLLHASCVAIGGKGVLLAGPPGAGKSDLALRLIDGGAALVADDQTLLRVEKNSLLAAPPTAIAGLIEVRHVGLLRLPYSEAVPVALYIELGEKPERLPEPDAITLLGIEIKRLRLLAFEASTPAKIRATLVYPLAENSSPKVR